MTDVSGRRVLIAGGTSGIGLATAQTLSDAGCRVFVIGRDEQRLNQAFERHAALKGATCDVRSDEQCISAVQTANKALSGIDAVVFSAGVGTYAPISQLSFDDYKAMTDTNLHGAFNICKAALPFLEESLRADIVLVGSRAGRYAFAGGVGYCASKFGLQGFAEALYLDVAGSSIAVSLVAPGTVATGFAGAKDEDWHLQSSDVADAVLGCLTSSARSNLNWIEMRPSRRNTSR